MMQYQETRSSPRGFSTISDFAVKLTDLIDMSLPQSIAHVSAVHSGLLVFQSSTDYIHSNRKSQVTAMTGTEAFVGIFEEEYPNKSALFGHVALLSCFLEV